MTLTNLSIGDKFRLTAPGHRNRQHVFTVESIRSGDNIGRPNLSAFNLLETSASGAECGVYTLPDNVLNSYQQRGWVLDIETGKPKR